MKKILIVSYYFPPCNIVSAQRAQSFADSLRKHGLHPVVVTRHWNGSENSTEGYESENLKQPAINENENYTLIQLPYYSQLNRFYHRPLLKFRAGKLLLYTFLYSIGNVNPKCNAYDCFLHYLIDYLRRNPVDFVFATGFPMNTIKLGSSLARMFKKPFIADFRDLWDNNLLAENYRPPSVYRLQNFFYEFYLRRWLKNARLIASVSQPLVDEIKRLAPQVKTLVVRNGFEADLFADTQKRYAPPQDKFVFSVIGTLKPNQDLPLMFEGLKRFLADKDLNGIELNFIGVNEFPEVKTLIEKRLPPVCTKATERIPRYEAIKQMLSSHVLFYAGWRGHRGIASGKIYEYLGARRNILIAPNDRDVLETIITDTNAGKIADNADQFAEIMNAWFAEWKSTGKIEYRGVEVQINNYTRDAQAEKLAREILRLE